MEDSFTDTLEQAFVAEEKAESIADSSSDSTPEGTAPPAETSGDSDAAATETGSVDASPAKPPEGFAPIAALQDERQKRQDLEIKLARLQGAADVEPKAVEKTVESGPSEDFWEDPDKFIASMESRTKSAIETALQVQAKTDQDARALRCERRAEKTHDDYATVKQAAHDKATQDPAWARTVVDSVDFLDDPAEAIYKAMKSFSAQAAFDPEAERAKIKTELLAELKGEGVDVDLPSLPRSQATAPGVGPTADTAIPDAGDAAFDGILLNY